MVCSTFALLWAFTPVPLVAEEVDSLLREGVRLHDQGEYEEAVERFQAALEIAPDHEIALYELGHTYGAMGEYELCVSTAQRGLDLEGRLEARLAAQVASCYSAWGKPKKALTVFRRGLDKHPDDVTLNFNVAVTLATQDQAREAIPHLKTAIREQPAYSSPYYLLGQLFAARGYNVPAIYSFMRFVGLEPNTNRSGHAASEVFRLLQLGVEETENGATITLDSEAPTDEGDFSALEVARTIAATSLHREEDPPKSPTQAAVDALTLFVQISRESSQPDLQKTFTWQFLTLLPFELKEDGHFEAFAYVLASRAGMEGATEWLTGHAEDVAQLESALTALAE